MTVEDLWRRKEEVRWPNKTRRVRKRRRSFSKPSSSSTLTTIVTEAFVYSSKHDNKVDIYLGSPTFPSTKCLLMPNQRSSVQNQTVTTATWESSGSGRSDYYGIYSSLPLRPKTSVSLLWILVTVEMQDRLCWFVCLFVGLELVAVR